MSNLTRRRLSIVCFIMLILSVSFAWSFSANADTPAETRLTNIHHRDGNRLLLFISDSDYSQVAATTDAKDAFASTNMVDNILCYLDDNTYVTLRTAMKADSEVYFNVWGETNSISVDTKPEYGINKIKYLTILEGCEFPSAVTKEVGYTQKADDTFINNTYGTDASATNWTIHSSVKTEGQLAVSVNDIQIRDNRLFFYFEGNNYAEMDANSDAADAVAACNIMDNVLIWTNETTSVPLADAAGSAKFYNLYASGALAIELKSTLYNAETIKMVTIKSGCQFPDNAGEPAFSQWGDITYLNGALDNDGNAVSWTVTDTPSEGLTVTEISKIQIRDNKLFIYLTKSNFATVDANASANNAIKIDNLLNNIVLYTETTSATLKDAMNDNKNAWFNHYGDMGSIAIQLDGEVFTNKSVNKIALKKDCEFPSALSGNSAYVTDKEEVFVNADSTETIAAEGYQSTNWVYEPINVYLRVNAAHIRGEIRKNGTSNVELLLFLDTATDYLSAPATTPVGDKISEYGFLDKILLWTSETDYITLKEAQSSTATYMDGGVEKTQAPTKEAYYNIWGEQNAISVHLGKYNADDIVGITLPKGTDFPSYDYTSGKTTIKKSYILAETINLIDYAPTQENHAVFSTNWAANRNYGDIDVTGIDMSAGVLELTLNDTDYPAEGTLAIENQLESAIAFYDHISLDGVSLAKYVEDKGLTLSSWINKTKYGTFAIMIGGYEDIVVNKIIIRKGCQLPIFANTAEGVEIHDVFYFEVKESVMFVRNSDGTYTKSDKITWTVTFDGKDAVEIEDGGNVTTLPTVTKEGYRFDGWKSRGADFTTSTVVNNDLDVTSVWTKIYTVTFNTDGGSAIDAIEVEDGGYISQPESPTKDGKKFDGWYVGDELFSFDNPITSDITLTAKWASRGCSGCSNAIGTASLFMSFLIVAAVIIRTRVKHKHQNNE